MMKNEISLSLKISEKVVAPYGKLSNKPYSCQPLLNPTRQHLFKKLKLGVLNLHASCDNAAVGRRVMLSQLPAGNVYSSATSSQKSFNTWQSIFDEYLPSQT